MTEAPSPYIREYVRQHDSLPDYPSSTPSGVNGDQAHFNANTYHIGISELPNKGGYTNRNWEDQMPAALSRWHASAIDTSMSTADMVKEWNRYLAVWQNGSDPRRKYVAEYIGWNGVGRAERLDFYTGSRTVSSDDHRWHSHKAVRRMYYNTWAAFHALLSIDRGETPAQYLASIGQGAAPLVQLKGKNMILVHKTVNGNTTYAMVTPNKWTELNGTVGAGDLPFMANSLASLTVDSKLMPADRYDQAKWWWDNFITSADTGVTDKQADAMADRIAAAVIAADTNNLSDADKTAVKQAVKDALREGTV